MVRKPDVRIPIMEQILEGSYVPPEREFPWMGRLYLHLLDEWNRTAAYFEFSVRNDIISVWQGEATRAVMDRVRFQRWFWNPIGNFEIDDLVWSVEGGRLGLCIEQAQVLFVPEVFIGQLASVL